MTDEQDRAAFLTPAVQATRRNLGYATPAMIAAGEPLTEAEIASLRRTVESIAAWGESIGPMLEEWARGVVAWYESIPPDVRAELMAETQAQP